MYLGAPRFSLLELDRQDTDPENHLRKIAIASALSLLFAGCASPPPPRVYVAPPPAPVVYQAPAPQPVVSVYVDPPLYQPPPIRVEWAPPPMLVETVTPMPYEGAVWTGGYWVWEGNWVWAHGRWAGPPQPGYGWVNPYYENRGGSVVFVNGFWAAPGVSFVAPSLSVNIAVGVVGVGVVAGVRPIGPAGVFVPAPPGSHFGLIVPAPIGTAPAVVTAAPPIIHEGMHINVNNNSTTINNVTNVHNMTNVTNVTVVAPASATASGQAVNTSVPAQPHLAAAMPPVVKAMAPEPASQKAIPAYVAGRQPAVLPPPQVVHSEVTPALMHPHTAEQSRPVAAPAQATPVPVSQAAHPSAPQAGEAPPRSAPAGNQAQASQSPPASNAKPAGLRQQQDKQMQAPPPAAKKAPANQPKPNPGNQAKQQKPQENKKPKQEGRSEGRHEKE